MKLKRSHVHDPLLPQEEIDALIQAALPQAAAAASNIKRGARAGDFQTSVTGGGTDLADLRPYSPGDDTRHIDWRASARSRQPMLRTWFAELNHPFFVVVDRRANMRYGSQRRLKITQAARLAITLLAREARAGREVGGLVMEPSGHWIPPLAGLNGAVRLSRLISAAAPPCDPLQHDEWHAAGSQLLQRLGTGVELVLVSDFSDFGPQHFGLLKNLARQFTTSAVQITDPLESSPTFPFPVNLRWGKQSLAVTSTSAAEQSRLSAQAQQFQQQLDSLFLKAGIEHQALSTVDDDLASSINSSGVHTAAQVTSSTGY